MKKKSSSKTTSPPAPALPALAFPGLTRFFVRLALAGAGLSLVFMLAGPFYARAVLPLHKAMLRQIQPNYELQNLTVTGPTLTLNTIAHRLMTDAQGIQRHATRMVPVSIPASALYLQPVILLALILAWSVPSWRKKFSALLLAIPLLIVIGLLDIPFTLAWEVEDIIVTGLPDSIKTISFAGMEIQTRVQDSQMLTYWYVFLQTGGRQFLALLAFFLCIAPGSKSPR